MRFTGTPARRPIRVRRGHGAFWVGALLLLAAAPASASALGSLATSLGVFAALAALVVMKSIPSPGSPLDLPALAGVAVCGGVAAWGWRLRGLPRLAAMARPWWRTSVEVASTACELRRPEPVELPAGMCRETLLADLRHHYVRVQEAWDQREHGLLRELIAPEMLAELLAERDQCFTQASPCRTEVVLLQADLLAVDQVALNWVATVEFSGLLREASARGSIPFREVWILTRGPAQSAGWRLARHQALW
jgi:Tim44-like domain